MELTEAIRLRRTTNGAFLSDAVRIDDVRRLMDAAARAPSHFNSQPCRFVLVEDHATITAIARISGASMHDLLEQGTFWKRYLRYFRFSPAEADGSGDGILFDRMPAALKPFRRHLFGATGQAVMNRLRVPATLGSDNCDLVAGSPLLLAVLLDRNEYRPGELSGFYSVVSMGAAIENIWLTTVELGMGIQFVSTPMEFPDRWAEIADLLQVPDSLELMAVFRLGYLPTETVRPTIDWTSGQRKRFHQFVFAGTCAHPHTELDELPPP